MRDYRLRDDVEKPVRRPNAEPVLLQARGESIKLHEKSSYRPPPNMNKRGKVKGFSKASRRRLLYRIAECGKSLPIFITLTYGAEFPDCHDAKAHLRKWWKRVKYQYRNDDLGAIWKLELQKRGAPHFHLLVYRRDGRKPWMCKDWIAQGWAEVTGDTSTEHVAAGTRVESIRTHHGAKFYAAKYLGKESSTDDAPQGRVWGALSSGNLPCEISDFWLTPMEARAFRHFVLLAVAHSKARREVGKVDDLAHRDYLVDERRDELVKEMLETPNRIPRTTMGDVSGVIEHIKRTIAEAENVPFGEVAKALEMLVETDTMDLPVTVYH